MDFHISTCELVTGNDVNVCVMFNCMNNTICSAGACNCSHIKNADPCIHSPSNLSLSLGITDSVSECVCVCVCVCHSLALTGTVG